MIFICLHLNQRYMSQRFTMTLNTIGFFIA